MLLDLLREFLCELTEIFDDFLPEWGQGIGFFSVLGDESVGLEVFKMKIDLGVIADFQIARNIHEAHSLFFTECQQNLPPDFIGKTDKGFIHVRIQFQMHKFQ